MWSLAWATYMYFWASLSIVRSRIKIPQKQNETLVLYSLAVTPPSPRKLLICCLLSWSCLFWTFHTKTACKHFWPDFRRLPFLKSDPLLTHFRTSFLVFDGTVLHTASHDLSCQLSDVCVIYTSAIWLLWWGQGTSEWSFCGYIFLYFGLSRVGHSDVLILCLCFNK